MNGRPSTTERCGLIMDRVFDPLHGRYRGIGWNSVGMAFGYGWSDGSIRSFTIDRSLGLVARTSIRAYVSAGSRSIHEEMVRFLSDGRDGSVPDVRNSMWLLIVGIISNVWIDSSLIRSEPFRWSVSTWKMIARTVI